MGREPKYQITAAYGHFGRKPYTENGMKYFEWENATDLSKYAAMTPASVEAELKNGKNALTLYGEHTHLHINPSGKFIIGGPQGDAGLTGRKIIIDTYGGWGAHGGGAFSGKDPTKVDRSAAYACRQMAKSLVDAGLCKRCLVQLSYAIGVAHPLSVNIDTYGTGAEPDEVLLKIIDDNFDLRPGCIMRD